MMAVTSRDRHPSMPDTPTVSESILKDFEYLGWIMVLAPAGTPQTAIDRLAASWSSARVQGAVKSRLDELGMSAPDRFAGNEALSAFLEAESARVGKLIRSAQIKVD